MRRVWLALLCLALTLQGASLSSCRARLTRFETTVFDCFDTVTTVTGYARSRAEFDHLSGLCLGELRECHRLFSIFDRFEGVNNLFAVNELSGGVHRELRVDDRIIGLLTFAKRAYDATGGKVNVAMGSVLSLWRACYEEALSDPSAARAPSRALLEAAAAHTDIGCLRVDPERGTVFLSDPEATLDVGAVAKGYAVELAARKLEEAGASGYLINAGGNLRAVGVRGDGAPWVAGIENPDADDGSRPFRARVALPGGAAATSGTYRRFYVANGRTYHHLIDPATCEPADVFSSVTALAPDAATADALSTALFLTNLEEGLALVESLPDTEALWVCPDGTERASSGFASRLAD